MSMTITLYHNDSDKRTLNKNITNAGALNDALIIDDTSILTPRLKVRDNGIIMVQYNYCYIADFKRYYFITDVTISNGYIYIDLKVDVLMTYQNEIKNLYAVIKRQQTTCNYYLDDEMYKSYEYSRIQTKEFPNGFTTNAFILAIAGGGN